jgi:hypothetical protein
MVKKNELETILDSKVITTTDLANLLKFATQPDEHVVTYKPSPAMLDVGQIISNGISDLEMIGVKEKGRIDSSDVLLGVPGKVAIQDVENSVKKFKRILNQTDRSLTDLGIQFGEMLLDESQKYIKEELVVRAQDPLKAKLANSTGETIKKLRYDGTFLQSPCISVILYAEFVNVVKFPWKFLES